MADALLGGVLPTIYSKADELKRGLVNWLKNPTEQAKNVGSQIVGSHLQQQDLMRQAFGDPENPFRITNHQALTQANEALLGGPLSFAPVGMVKPSNQFLENLVEDYKGSHIAPNAKVYGGTLDNLGAIMPVDVYSSKGTRLYGIGNPKIDAEWFKAAYMAKGNPDKEIEIFRAVPKGVKNINNGDWVTTSKTYAQNHGENALNGEYEIISKKVKAKELSSEGYPYEFGYHFE